jgi:hypothetical protein
VLTPPDLAALHFDVDRRTEFPLHRELALLTTHSRTWVGKNFFQRRLT